ncbi:DUF3784 domain-containing protein [Haloimpatiens sp. FM7315]|uniref:DUF3784 domain-containing protein n=1 Tax=Haloimpatiens sp. FM7315 TaxID=3298609 RepID=UPI0035A3317F
MFIGTAVFLIALFILFGIMLSLGKWSFLISGYNMMSQVEKDKYNEKAICKAMGNLMFSIAFCLFLSILSDVLNMDTLRQCVFIAIFIITVSTIIYLNVGKKFKKGN